MDANNHLVSPPTPASTSERDSERDGGIANTPVAPAGPLGRFRSALAASVWAPVLGKAIAIVAGMIVLAGIGGASTLAGTGVPVPQMSAPPNTSAGSAPAPRMPAPHASDGASSPAATPPSAAAPSPPSTNTAPASGVTADGKVVLNAATAEELTKLPRVGAKRALAIVELRKKLGRFKAPTDLLRVKGIGRKTLKLMLPLLVLDAPGAAAK